MLERNISENRALKKVTCHGDLVVVGGGLAGICCAINAARSGIKVILVQDRPVLGGNSSSEIRLWILGATSHMGNNNRWAREGGVLGEIYVENMFRNREGNAVIFDTILLDKVYLEKNITLLLNTSVYEVITDGNGKINKVVGFCSQNSTIYELHAHLFCDSSGDGIVAFLAGVPFRIGAESKAEFNEGFAPTREYGRLLGHTIYFYSKNVGHPVKYIPPSFAIKDVPRQIPKYKKIKSEEQGVALWWVEYGGSLDTIHDSEIIKWRLWEVCYGIWDFIKNSGSFKDVENLTLEWVGTVPGKRESRRFEGLYILTQNDVIKQTRFNDAIAYGGWAVDLHPQDNVFSELPACNQYHSKGIYQIPLRCFLNDKISNLFIAGRIISATHVAFGSTRVMGTCANGGQALGIAAALCIHKSILPGDLLQKENLNELQRNIIRSGIYIPFHSLSDQEDLVTQAMISVSSEFALKEIPADGEWYELKDSMAQMIPVNTDSRIPEFTLQFQAHIPSVLKIELRISEKPYNYTPEIILEKRDIHLQQGSNVVNVRFDTLIAVGQYVYVCLLKDKNISVKTSRKRYTGILSLFNKIEPRVANYGKQDPPQGIGIESFEFWCPKRRPDGPNIAMNFSESLPVFSLKNLLTGLNRPVYGTNAWVASPDDPNPVLYLEWSNLQKVKKIILLFDTDYDHPMESVHMGHPENVMPFCVQDFSIEDDQGNQVYQFSGNYQGYHEIVLDSPLETKKLNFHLRHPSEDVPAALFEVRCY